MAVEPVYGQGFFHVGWGVIFYTIIFDYYDPYGEYLRVLRDNRLRREEEDYIRSRMQGFLGSERILVNGRPVNARVDSVRLELRGLREVHSATIHVYMEYEPLQGTNVYEDYYEPDKAEYDYTVYWVAPPGGRILHVETPGRLELTAGGRIAVISVRRGTRLDGYEAVMFRLADRLGGEA